MINFYLITEVARLEHEERVRSLAPIPDFFEPVKADQPGWVSRQSRRLRDMLERRLPALRKRMRRGQDNPLDAPLTENRR